MKIVDDIKMVAKNFFNKHFRDHKELKEIIITCLFLMLLGCLALGFFLGRYTAYKPNVEKSVDRAEYYMWIYKNYYGNQDLNVESGNSESEKILKQSLNMINIPKNMWDKNLTINKAIKYYDFYKPPSRLALGVLLSDICR